MSLISALRPTACCPQSSPGVIAAPTSDTPVPMESVDFSKIDTAQKALLMPVHEPAALIAVGAGLMYAFAGSMSGSIPQVAIEVSSKSAGKLTTVQYTFDMLAPSNQLCGSGQVDGHQYHDAISRNINSKGAILEGALADNISRLTLGADRDAANPDGYFVLRGNIGDVAHDIKYKTFNGSKGLQAEGIIGGQRYVSQLTFDNGAGRLLEMEDGSATASFRGTIGDADIAKDYTIKQQRDGDSIFLTVNGSGTTAGVPQEVTASVKVTR